jgi:hypothetical protein
LIETRTDGLADLGEQFVLLRAAMGIVGHQVVIQSQAELQSQSYHQAGTGCAEGFALRVREKNDSECIFAGLQAHGGQVADFCVFERALGVGEGSGRPHGKRLGHLSNIADGEQAAIAVSQVADVFSGAAFGEDVEKFRRKTALHGRQPSPPTLADKNHGAARG